MASLKPIRCGDYTLNFDRALIMGILNVTPDSFSDGGRFVDQDLALEHAVRMASEGADIIDIGAESSRPGARPVSPDEEIARLKPVIERLVKDVNLPISVDTYKPKVASECLRLGAHMINDITGLANDAMAEAVANHHAPVIIMHMRGTPQTMQANPVYDDVVAEVKRFLKERKMKANAAGIKDVIVDPGIGFGKTVKHNLELIRRLPELETLHCPILVGPSRKSFIGEITGLPADKRLEGTLAAVTASVLNGANIIRVHDVRECRRAAQVADAIARA